MYTLNIPNTIPRDFKWLVFENIFTNLTGSESMELCMLSYQNSISPLPSDYTGGWSCKYTLLSMYQKTPYLQ